MQYGMGPDGPMRPMGFSRLDPSRGAEDVPSSKRDSQDPLWQTVGGLFVFGFCVVAFALAVLGNIL